MQELWLPADPVCSPWPGLITGQAQARWSTAPLLEPGASVLLKWAHPSLDATQRSLETIQWTHICHKTSGGDIAQILAKEKLQALQVLIILQSQSSRIFGNRIFMISTFIQIATVTRMIPRWPPSLICWAEYISRRRADLHSFSRYFHPSEGTVLASCRYTLIWPTWSSNYNIRYQIWKYRWARVILFCKEYK